MNKIALGGLFVLLLLGVVLHGTFGIPMDETIMHNLAIKAFEYIQGVSPWPEDTANRFHGPFVEIIIHTIQRVFGVSDVAGMAGVRHLITYLFYVAGVAAFYFLARLHTKSDMLALVGAGFLVFSPRIFGHAFINSRDVPFMALFTVAMLTLSIFLEKRSIQSAVLFGIATAAALSVRSMGVFLPIIALCMLGPRLRSNIKPLGVYAVSLMICTYAFWPLLWANPIKHFFDAVLFSGSFSSTPAYYVPVWIAVTTPVLYSVLAVIGIVIAVRNCKEHLLPLLWLLLPLVVMLVMSAGIYNGWRHVFFLYPAVLLLSLTGLQWCIQKVPQKVLFAVLALSFLHTGYFMVRYHPIQATYFSIPVRSLERDYWAVSAREALNAIADQDDDPIISIFATNRVAYINAYAYFDDRVFIEAPSDAKANYIIDFTHDQLYAQVLPPEMLLKEITSGGLTVARVFKGPTHASRPIDREADLRKVSEIKALPRAPWEYGSYSRKNP